MYGLIMIKEYLDEILNGEKNYDARSYDTNKRCTIALGFLNKSNYKGIQKYARGVHSKAQGIHFVSF